MGSCAFRAPVRAGNPGGRPWFNMCALGASVTRRPTSGPYKAAAPALTFPISCRGGGVCACEASAGGRASRVGARFAQDVPARNCGRKCADLVLLFYLGAGTSAYRKAAPSRERPCRRLGAGSAHGSPRMGRGRAAMNRATPKRSGVTPHRAGACSA